MYSLKLTLAVLTLAGVCATFTQQCSNISYVASASTSAENNARAKSCGTETKGISLINHETSLTHASAGSIAVLSTDPVVLRYNTSTPNEKNRIALYSPDSEGPVNERVAPAMWKYATQTGGTAHFNTEDLPAGLYRAYFLANGTSTVIGEGIDVAINKAAAHKSTFVEDYDDKNRKKYIKFNYTTPVARNDNWIGLWRAYDGAPDHEGFNKPAILWEYAPHANGSFIVDPKKVSPGSYKAFFLEQGGYKWLADPIGTVIRPARGADTLTPIFTGRSLRPGVPFEWDISAASKHGQDPRAKWDLRESAYTWARVDGKGIIHGIPQETRDTNRSIGTFMNGSPDVRGGANMDVFFPVVIPPKPLVKTLKIISMQLWDGGTHVDGYHSKQCVWVAKQDVDIVTMQGTLGHHGARIAHTLGWSWWQGEGIAIMSRYPIGEVYPSTSFVGGVRIEIEKGKQEVIVYNAWLSNSTYGPYNACFNGVSPEKLLELEESSGRAPQMREIMNRIRQHFKDADTTPVFLTGDFNSPSHLDWTNSTRNHHCNYGATPWPASTYPEKDGMIDIYRYLNPNATADPGTTWSPFTVRNEERNITEPHDRIDIIYHKGARAVPKDAKPVYDKNEWEKAKPNVKQNRWTSDHLAAYAAYEWSY